MDKDSVLKKYALEYAENGLAVFPLQIKDKIPLTKNGCLEATTNPTQIEAWWKKWPLANIGIATGDKSGGLFVIDLDIDEDKDVNGYDSLRQWEKSNGNLPDTWQSITGRGGYHLFYRSKDKVSNRVNLMEGVDVRGEGGYIVAPPSIHPNGNPYEWEQSPEEFELAEADEIVMKFINQKSEEEHQRLVVPEVIRSGERNSWIFKTASSMQAKGFSRNAIIAAVNAENKAKCQPPLSEEEVEKIIKSVLRYESGTATPHKAILDNGVFKPINETGELPYKQSSLVTELKQIKPEDRYSRDDKGNGALFADLFKNKCRFNTTAKEWYCYDGRSWSEDTGGMIASRYAKLLADALLIYATTIQEETKKTAYIQHVAKLGQLRYRNTMLQDARDQYFISNDDLDKDLYLLNCQNGTMNLKTFEFQEHNPDDLLSKISNVYYKPDAKSPLFEKYIDEIMLNNQEKTSYLQKLLGYSLTGDTSQESCYILYGASTRNGKGTLMETIAYMMGNTDGYALAMKPETLAQRQNNDSRQASGDIARLKGCRFLNASEPPKRMLFDAGLLKTLLGRDTITARHLHEREFEFIPCFKLFINTNHLPLIQDDTLFTSGRINVITFDRHFNEDEQDKSLKNKLRSKENISGIFNWCLDGLQKYYKDGVKPPETVNVATEDYRLQSDKIGNFISEMLVKSDKNSKAGEVYQAYQRWCQSNGFGQENKSNFYAELKSKGIFKLTGAVCGKTEHNVVSGYVINDTESIENADNFPFR